MAEPFIGEIRIFAFGFAPNGWAQCNGQVLPIAQNTALFSLVGTIYGGDDKTTFGLPDLRGKAAMHSGQGPGGTVYWAGQVGGSATVSLSTSQIPSHAHAMVASAQAANQLAPGSTQTLAASSPGLGYQSNASQNLTQMHPYALGSTGYQAPHNNRQPSLVLNFCIALEGIFPSRPQQSQDPRAAG